MYSISQKTYIGGTRPEGYVIFCSSTNFFATTIGFLTPEIYSKGFMSTISMVL